MIRFFRKARITLLENNRVRKYVLYAIGEILLVMIGILLALQVNNWNEGVKEREVETALLENLRSDLIRSRSELEIDLSTNKKYLDRYLDIRTALEQDQVYTIELDTAFGSLDVWAQPYLSTVTYETIKAKGLDIIRNDSLKQHIAAYYSFDVQSLMDDMIAWEWSFNQNTTQRFMVTRVRRLTNTDLARPIDFEALKKDDEFLNFLSILIALRGDHLKYTEETLQQANSLIAHLNHELQSR